VTLDEQRDLSDGVAPTPTRPAFVRPATPDDETRLRRLRDAAFEDLGTARGWEMFAARNAAALPDLHADWSTATERVWLGGLEGVELGYLIGSVVPLPSGEMLGVIDAIAVEQAVRGCGIGAALMSVALAWFRAHGCVGVESTALPGERATKNFFEEHGLKARLLTVYQSFAEAPGEA
jgi:GNAT superfamily N-acetyltransferase